MLVNGIKLAVDIQKKIVAKGCALIEKRQVVSGPFRYTIMKASPNDYYFTNELTLSKLGLFVCTAFQVVPCQELSCTF